MRTNKYLRIKLANGYAGVPGMVPYSPTEYRSALEPLNPHPTTREQYYRGDRFGNEVFPVPEDADTAPGYYKDIDPDYDYSPGHYANVHYSPTMQGNVNPKFEKDPDKPYHIPGGIVWRGMFIPDAAINKFIADKNPDASAIGQWWNPYKSQDSKGNKVDLPHGVTPRMIVKYIMDTNNRPYESKPGTLSRKIEELRRGREFRDTEILGGTYDRLNAPVGPDGTIYYNNGTTPMLSTDRMSKQQKLFLAVNRKALANTLANTQAGVDHVNSPEYEAEAIDALVKPKIGFKGLFDSEPINMADYDNFVKTQPMKADLATDGKSVPPGTLIKLDKDISFQPTIPSGVELPPGYAQNRVAMQAMTDKLLRGAFNRDMYNVLSTGTLDGGGRWYDGSEEPDIPPAWKAKQEALDKELRARIPYSRLDK